MTSYFSFGNIPRHQYQVIVANPPWIKQMRGSMKSKKATKYPNPMIEELKVIPVQEIAATDSILFLWTTPPLRRDSIGLLRLWGYEYEYSIDCYNEQYSMGFLHQGQKKPCLIGIRGKVAGFRSIERKISTIKKPIPFWKLVEPFLDEIKLSSRIELFARVRRPGWDSFGSQIQQTII